MQADSVLQRSVSSPACGMLERLVSLSTTDHILERSVSSPNKCVRLLKVDIIKGDITQDSSHAIVNSSDNKLENPRGVGRCLMKAAGNDVSKELKDYIEGQTELPSKSVLVTGPGSLKCRYLFHAIGPTWKNYKDKSRCCRDLTLTIVKCLFEAHRRKLASIAFPAVCAGNSGIPPKLCAESYVRALKIFESKISRGPLRFVRFIDVKSKMVDLIQKQFDAEWDVPYDPVVVDPWQIAEIIVCSEDPVKVKTKTDTSNSAARSNGSSLVSPVSGPVDVSGPTDPIIQQFKTAFELRHRSANQPSQRDDDDDGDDQTGSMPPGMMSYTVKKGQLPGFQGNEHIVIEYKFKDRDQSFNHPRPGLKYTGNTFYSYLPHTSEGFLILKLLQKAFERRLLFAIGKASPYSDEYTVTWANISQKRNETGGRARYGYPDPDYFTRVRKELAKFGIKDPE